MSSPTDWHATRAIGRGMIPIIRASSQTGAYSILWRKVDKLGRYHRGRNISNGLCRKKKISPLMNADETDWVVFGILVLGRKRSLSRDWRTASIFQPKPITNYQVPNTQISKSNFCATQ
jgi:hypothetical protein